MDQPDNAGVKLLPPVMLVICALICTATEIWLPLPPMGLPQPFSMWLGNAVIAAGFLTGTSGIRRFTKAKVNPVPTKPVSALITGGIYRYTRNPMYIAMVALFLGVALILNSFAFLAGGVAMFAYFNMYAIPREEAYMTRTFGEAYTAYRTRVRRWL